MAPHKIDGIPGTGTSNGNGNGNGGGGTGSLDCFSSPDRQWIMGTKAFGARMPHHDGIKALWETKWKFPVSFLV